MEFLLGLLVFGVLALLIGTLPDILPKNRFNTIDNELSRLHVMAEYYGKKDKTVRNAALKEIKKLNSLLNKG